MVPNTESVSIQVSLPDTMFTEFSPAYSLYQFSLDNCPWMNVKTCFLSPSADALLLFRHPFGCSPSLIPSRKRKAKLCSVLQKEISMRFQILNLFIRHTNASSFHLTRNEKNWYLCMDSFDKDIHFSRFYQHLRDYGASDKINHKRNRMTAIVLDVKPGGT